MSEFKKNGNGFISNEYKEIIIKHSLKQLYIDAYASFGWNLESSSTPLYSLGSVILNFKRNRKILNKTELTRLQRQFEACVTEIEKLKLSRTVAASAAAYGAGLAGTAFMVGAAFAYFASILPLTIVLSIPGFIGWGLPYFLYLRISKKKTETSNALIEQKYDEIYDVCDKANNLLP